MFKHPACGGQHETVIEARQCERENGAIRQNLQTPANALQEIPPVESLAEINADQEPWPWSYRKGKDQHPFDLGRRAAEAMAEERGPIDKDAILVKRIDSLMNSGVDRRADLENGPGWTGPVFMAPEPGDPVPSEWRSGPADDEPTSRERYASGFSDAATIGQKNFVRILLDERDRAQITDESVRAESIRADIDLESLTFASAQLLIPALKALPKKAAPAPAQEHREQPWKTLSREVPAGNYKVTDEAGKNRFYRVSTGKNGYYKLQERASEELFFIPLKGYKAILESILATGVDSARLAYAQDQTRCWHCNTKLTDNTGNPHYGRGLGPKCGEEH